MFCPIDRRMEYTTLTVYDHRVWQARVIWGFAGAQVDWSSNTGYKAGTDWRGRPASDEVLWLQARAQGTWHDEKLVPAPGWGRPRIDDGEPGKPWVRGAASVAHGWPLLAVWCSVREDPERIGDWERTLRPIGPPSTPAPPDADGWAPLPTQGMTSPVRRPLIVSGAWVSPIQGRAVNFEAETTLLPWRPLWAGFAANTALYSALWFGVLFVPGAARRWVRLRRGRCLKCGYDLRGNLAAGCPECGWGRLPSAGAAPANQLG